MPTSVPSSMPTSLPTSIPTSEPSPLPTSMPTSTPSVVPSYVPTSSVPLFNFAFYIEESTILNIELSTFTTIDLLFQNSAIEF